jgi:hypothetical protein
VEEKMGRWNTAALKKRAQTLAAKGDDSMIELSEALSELRDLPKPPDGDRPTLDELVDLTKLSRRTICYLLKVWQMVDDLGIPRNRLVRIGWTKMAVLAENLSPRRWRTPWTRRDLHREGNRRANNREERARLPRDQIWPRAGTVQLEFAGLGLRGLCTDAAFSRGSKSAVNTTGVNWEAVSRHYLLQ